jgi:hypothetical protein
VADFRSYLRLKRADVRRKVGSVLGREVEMSEKPYLKLVPEPGPDRLASAPEPLEGWWQLATGPEGAAFYTTDSRGISWIVAPFRLLPHDRTAAAFGSAGGTKGVGDDDR